MLIHAHVIASGKKARGNTRNAQPYTGLSILPLVWACGSRSETFSAPSCPSRTINPVRQASHASLRGYRARTSAVLIRAGLPKGQAFDEVA
jgi:hypothetical protein